MESKHEEPLAPRQGWVRSIRQSKAIAFCSCTDGQNEFQITIKEGCPIDGDLKVGCSFLANGVDSTTPRGLYEFLCSSIKVVGPSDDSFPIQPKEHGDDFLRTIPQSRGRSAEYARRWIMRSYVAHGIHRFLHHKGYHQYFTPIITEADCEGAGETFKASSDWMDESLTVSGQLHLEVGMMSMGKVYTFSPCFRAEKSMTRKHLSEFWMLEVEKPHGDLHSSMNLCEAIIREALFVAVQAAGQDMPKLVEKIESNYMEPFSEPWPRLTYEEVCKELHLKYGDDIGAEAEQKLMSQFRRPVFITHYPKDMKPFYMRKDDKVAYCFDLIFPEVGELVGGSEREPDHDKIKLAMEQTGMDMSKMQWYLDTRRWGTVPHAGFGLGFERLMMYLTGAEKVHDVIPFPVSYK